LGGVGVVLALAKLAPGWHRRAFLTLLAAVCLSPAPVGGHGIGVSLAVLMLFSPDPLTGSWDPTDGYGYAIFIALMCIALLVLGSIPALVSRMRGRAHPDPDRPITQGQIGAVVVAYVLCLGAFAGSVLYRLHWRDSLGSYGPFGVTVDAGPGLRDIVVNFSCSAPGSFQYYSASAIVESGKTYDFPRRYLRGSYRELSCSITTAHPYLQPTARKDHLTDVRPDGRIVLPPLHPEPWSEERYLQILGGSEVPPDSLAWRAAENAVGDDWAALSTVWLARFCGKDFERIRREYLPTIAARRTRLLALRMPSGTDDKSSQEIVLSIWRSTCDDRAQHGGPAL
jgi:hypothetical protein